MPCSCRAKQALLKGLRPLLATPQQMAATRKILAATCATPCIYCDIWKLATLIASHAPLCARYSLLTGTPANSPISSPPSSPVASSPLSQTPSDAASPYAQIITSSKKIEAQFQTQRSRLSSIISICTVSGADETEGLRMAHDRCSAAIEELLDQEEELEEELLRGIQEQQYAYEFEFGYTSQFGYDPHRRPSMIDVTI